MEIVYKPFINKFIYFDQALLSRTINPTWAAGLETPTILVSCQSNSIFSCFMVNKMFRDGILGDTYGLPLRRVVLNKKNEVAIVDGISDAMLEYCIKFYRGENILKEDLFFYIYALLHSTEYREKYKYNLQKFLPRLLLVSSIHDFFYLSKAGRSLANLHLYFNNVEMFAACYENDISLLNDGDFYVQKMKFPTRRQNGKFIKDYGQIIYNKKITITNIPMQIYKYILGDNPAIFGILNNQCEHLIKKAVLFRMPMIGH